MKKLVLFMVFILLMTFFIAFNYLLWDRDSKIKELTNLESLNAGKAISLDAQNREIDKLEADKTALQDRLDSLEKDKEQLTSELDQLTAEKGAVNRKLQNKIDLVNIMKNTANLDEFAKPLIDWADYINAGEYEAAYNLQFSSTLFNEETISSQEYAEGFKTTIKSLKYKSYEVDKEKGIEDGSVYLKVSLEAELLPDININNSKYKQGINVITARVDYNSDMKSYYIGEISEPEQPGSEPGSESGSETPEKTQKNP
ncbi:MAG: hypothetical protein HGA22_11490 [Clostridiales bacterium]|nr:hypothetical protein [Clostridiales bacterium]